MADHLGLGHDLLGPFKALDVVHIRMGGDQILALIQREIHIPDQVDHVIERVFIPDIDQHPLPGIMHHIHRTPQPPTGLEVHLDHVRENFVPRQHAMRYSEGAWRVKQTVYPF